MEVPKGTMEVSKASTTLVPDTNPGMAPMVGPTNAGSVVVVATGGTPVAATIWAWRFGGVATSLATGRTEAWLAASWPTGGKSTKSTRRLSARTESASLFGDSASFF